MISHLTQYILSGIQTHGAWSVFLGVLIEQIIVPIPSPAIIMGAGLLLVPADVLWGEALRRIALQIVLPGSLASLLGAVLGYEMARWGGKVFVDRYHRFLGFDWDDVTRLGENITKRGVAPMLFFLRAIPVIPLSLISVVGGVLKIDRRRFLVWSFLGSVPRCALLGILGWRLRTDVTGLATGLNRWESWVSLGLVAGAIFFVLYWRHRVRGKV